MKVLSGRTGTDDWVGAVAQWENSTEQLQDDGRYRIQRNQNHRLLWDLKMRMQASTRKYQDQGADSLRRHDLICGNGFRVALHFLIYGTMPSRNVS